MTRLLPLLLAALLALPPSGADAQTDPGPTYQDTTGLTWSVATLELGLIMAAIGIAASDPQSAQAIGVLLFAAGVAASGIVAGVAQATNAPVEPPMVFHHGLVGGALLGGLLSFSLRAAGVGGDAPAWAGLVGLILGAAGAATYSVLRMERLAHDPQLVEEAHVLSWAPILSAGLITALMAAAGLAEAGGIIGAVAGIVALGISIALVEVAIEENPPPEEPAMMEAPLMLGYGGRF